MEVPLLEPECRENMWDRIGWRFSFRFASARLSIAARPVTESLYAFGARPVKVPLVELKQ
jgi:hypothetical protein